MSERMARIVRALAEKDPDTRDWEVMRIENDLRDDDPEHTQIIALIDSAYYGTREPERRGF